jgi:hypothetical protein
MRAFKVYTPTYATTPALHLPYLNQPIKVEIDASHYVIGVVLKHRGHSIPYPTNYLPLEMGREKF